RRIMLAEYALLGALGALTGVVLSTLAGWGLMHFIFRMPFSPALLPAALVALSMMALAVVIGLLTGRDVFAETPMAALRETCSGAGARRQTLDAEQSLDARRTKQASP